VHYYLPCPVPSTWIRFRETIGDGDSIELEHF
jgi:hypothetical protein